MITWMQRHKKWLIITIWISTIAFIGAGFVGWGQYSYGDKAGAVAKVGDEEISLGELQKEYADIYARYNEVFQGNFDEAKAKQFGLQKQALQRLIQKALIINLAHSYDLSVSDRELYEAIKAQKAFYKNGMFDKETYKQVLSQNRMSVKEFESSLRKQLLIQKTFSLLPVVASQNEKNIFTTLLSIADKLDYKVLSQDDIKVQVDDAKLQAFWKTVADKFQTEVLYQIAFIKVSPLDKTYTDSELSQYYTENKTHFKDQDGKILPFEKAKISIAQELNKKATKDQALRTYIAFKKEKIQDKSRIQEKTLTQTRNPFNEDAFNKIATLSSTTPYAKPVLVGDTYYIFKLIKVTPARTKTFAEAKQEVLPLYLEQTKKQKLLELAEKSYNSFHGDVTDFITLNDASTLTLLSQDDAIEFIQRLFTSDKKNYYIPLRSGKIVLYHILEQKLLTKTSNANDTIVKVKEALFNEGLIKTLQNKYQTEIFIKGL